MIVIEMSLVQTMTIMSTDQTAQLGMNLNIFCQILRVLSPFVLLTQIYCVGHPIYIPVSYYSAPYPNPIKWMEFLSLSGDLLKNYLNIVISVLLVFMIFTWMWMALLPGLKLWRFKHLMKGTTIAFSLACFL